ncbi:MAG: response regulator [Candidatus Omnitrophica bacterium]|nr:response regulator [Candidatus Omnitrophota bacterium]
MSKKILVVDDNEDLRKELKDFLEDYDVLEAASGEAALVILRRANDLGLIILDVMMPGISGIDVLQEIRRTDPNLGVIILTGHSSKDVAIDALKAHADDYIEKPINIKKLQDAVERLIASKSGEPEISSLDLMGKLNKVKRFIESNCYKKIGLTEAADLVRMSPKYLSRVFSEHMKVGFNEYKLKIKMREAKKLLTSTGYTVNQITEKLGYENSESFICQFKKFEKDTPAQYRQKIKKKK